MTVTVDTNLLLYASDVSSPFHERASELLRTLAAGPDLVYIFWPAALGYLRISTHPSIFGRPLTAEEAIGNLDDLVTRPHVRTGGEGERFWQIYRQVVDVTPARGNLIADAHLVGLMRQYGVSTIWSHDRDLRKFPDITVRDPF